MVDQNSLKYYRDMNNVVNTARQEGRKAGKKAEKKADKPNDRSFWIDNVPLSYAFSLERWVNCPMMSNFRLIGYPWKN
jgi:hypothetical protein